MARSFSSTRPDTSIADYYHETSGTHYSMLERAGTYYQRRWQIGYDGREINVEELRADLTMGSGNHARTFLHRTNQGKLIQLPLGWYAEKGGYWAMNPGYDTPHPPARRAIGYECMFCHNSYPKLPAGHEQLGAPPVFIGTLPEGIDCQRCHGPGARHITTAKSPGARLQDIRASIVNPSRLSKERQMEVCMQCHLETTSTRLPGMIRRFDRSPLSYIPGQPLSEFVLYFDHASGAGHDDKFEIAGGAYRLRQSQCFLRSKGELTCETCHDPHNIPRGREAATYYASVCRQCHGGAVDRLAASGKHPVDADCARCHMPKRRTDDAVHVVMTDHLIPRRPPTRDLLAEIPESHPSPSDEYRGEVVPYYPAPLARTRENQIYIAIAQVQQGSNLSRGIAQLTSLLAGLPSARPDFYMALGDACHLAGDPAQAVRAYSKAVTLKPNSARASRYLGIALKDSGQRARGADVLQLALQLSPTKTFDASQAWFEIALLDSGRGQIANAISALRSAIALDPDSPDMYNSLGVSQAAMGKAADAERAFRKALELDPWYATAHGNLARILAERGDAPQAVYHFDKVARLQPSGAVNLYEYALTLVRMNRFDDSQKEVEAAVRADPNLAEAHELLGGLLARKKDLDAALREYREAVRLKPEFSRAQLDLAATLTAKGDLSEAIPHFREAAKSADPRIAQQAAAALRQVRGN